MLVKFTSRISSNHMIPYFYTLKNIVHHILESSLGSTYTLGINSTPVLILLSLILKSGFICGVPSYIESSYIESSYVGSTYICFKLDLEVLGNKLIDDSNEKGIISFISTINHKEYENTFGTFFISIWPI